MFKRRPRPSHDGRQHAGMLRRSYVLVALLGAAIVAGCDSDPDDPLSAYAAAVPKPDRLLVAGALFDQAAPAEVVSGGLSQATLPLVGQPSQLRQAAQAATRDLNGKLNAMLHLAATVIEGGDGNAVSDSRVVWHGQPSGEADAYILIVQRVGDAFDYAVYTQDRATPGAGFVGRVYGTTVPGEAGFARGALWIDFDTDRKPSTHGKMLALWSGKPKGRRETTVFKYETSSAGIERFVTSFHFVRNLDGSGLVSFGPYQGNVTPADPDRQADETIKTVVRWTAAGNGRADAVATGGDLIGTGVSSLMLSQCWNVAGDLVFQQFKARTSSTAEPAQTADGDRSRCAYDRALAPPLLSPGDPPVAPPIPPEVTDGDTL